MCMCQELVWSILSNKVTNIKCMCQELVWSILSNKVTNIKCKCQDLVWPILSNKVTNIMCKCQDLVWSILSNKVTNIKCMCQDLVWPILIDSYGRHALYICLVNYCLIELYCFSSIYFKLCNFSQSVTFACREIVLLMHIEYENFLVSLLY